MPRFLLRPNVSTVAAVALLVAGAWRQAEAQTLIAVSGVVKDVSGGAVADAMLDALVGERIIARTISGADGRFTLHIPAHTPIALRTRRTGFADDVATIEGSRITINHDVTLSIGTLSDTLNVTASRGLESRQGSTQSLSLVDLADIQALGSAGLADILRFMPGTSVDGTGREGGGPVSLFVRGGDSDYNVVLIDGVRANLDGGRFDFSRVAAGEIQRVEVLRGAQSALWGADAMTAVVQVFTARGGTADIPEVSGSLEAGSFRTIRGNAGIQGGVSRRLDYHAAITSRRTNGAFAGTLPDDDRFRQHAFGGGLGVAIGMAASARGGVRYSDADGRSVGPLTFGARDRGSAYQTRDLSVYGSLSHVLGARFSGTATVNYFRYRGRTVDTVPDPFVTYAILAGTPSALYPNGTRLVRLLDASEFDALVAAGALPAPGQFLASAPSADFLSNPATEVTRFRRPAIQYQGTYIWMSGQELTAGYDWERDVNPGIVGYSLDNVAVFVQHQSTAQDRWFITAGLRVDHKESYDTYVSPRLSLGGLVIPHRTGAVSSLKVFGNIGHGVKSPTFGERFGNAGFADPNPAIRVEQARSGDIGAELTLVDQTFHATVICFQNHFTDQISFRFGPAGDGIPEFINIDGSRAQGLELEWTLQRPLRGITAAATYTYLHTEVVTNQSTSQQFQPGQPLLRRPRHSGSLRVAYSRGRTTVNVSVRQIGDRFDNSFLALRTVPNAERPTAVTTDITVNPGYTVATVGVDLRLTHSFSMFVRGDNIGDTAYDSALGYPGLPRAVVIGARFRYRAR